MLLHPATWDDPRCSPHRKFTLLLALPALASAFTTGGPAFTRGISARHTTSLYETSSRYGTYDDKLWDNEAKKEIYNAWDPNSPRSAQNFNPFETNKDGNSCDASGYFPGEGFYKDPIRPDMNFTQMMEERKEMEERNANPKEGDVAGAPGRVKGN